jgi:pathogenesis-related protein 1
VPAVYESPLVRVYGSMRLAIWFLIARAGTGSEQWRRFGHGPAEPAQPSLSRGMLAAHNAVRACVGMPPPAWSDRLAARSQDWAGTLPARRQFIHRPNSTYGENLFEIAGASASAAQVVNAWAAESRNYDYISNGCSSVCGHCTQIVWGDTNEVGCAEARGRGREICVCNLRSSRQLGRQAALLSLLPPHG